MNKIKIVFMGIMAFVLLSGLPAHAVGGAVGEDGVVPVSAYDSGDAWLGGFLSSEAGQVFSIFFLVFAGMFAVIAFLNAIAPEKSSKTKSKAKFKNQGAKGRRKTKKRSKK